MKPPKTKSPPGETQIGVRLPRTLVEQLDRYVEERNVSEPGIGLTRSDAVRVLLTRALSSPQK